MSNQQYMQWISGKKRGEIESVEMMQDGQTFEDIVLLSNGGKIPMSKIGKDFIILPSSSSALSALDLDLMYPIETIGKVNRSPVKKEHQSIMGMDVVNDAMPVQQQKKPPKSTFASDLLSRSKKSVKTIKVNLSVEIPSSEFFDMINKTFDEQTVNEVIDLISDSIKAEDIKQSIKTSIIHFYEDTI